MIDFIRRAIAYQRARDRVVIAARCLEGGYVPELDNQVDPDDLRELIAAVRELRAITDPAPRRPVTR